MVEDELLKNRIIELALKLDENLIRLLLSHSRLRQHFFADIDGVLVFDKEKFLQFVSNKAFLPDSYTAFKNKIGLTGDGGRTYLSRRREVVLAWPYRDCVLEGGQTEEDAKRDEVFWNETLAPDDIDRLLDPKVLTNFRRIDADGEHPVMEIADTDNLIIKGNNLLALHSLKARLGRKVKLIYIDPPFNTGGDSFGYNDRFKHSTWLTFMKNRLEVARDLLRDDGVILVHIDDTEVAYLRVLLDEIFGRDNFLSQITWERSPGAGLGQGGKFLINVCEYMLAYARDWQSVKDDRLTYLHDIPKKNLGQYSRYVVDYGEKELIREFRAKSDRKSVKIFKHTNYQIGTISLRDYKTRKAEIIEEYVRHFDSVFRTNRVQKENSFQQSIIRSIDSGLHSVEYIPSRGKHKGKLTTLYYLNNELFSWLGDVAVVQEGKIYKVDRINDFWTKEEITSAGIAGEGGVKLLRGKKPEALLQRIIEMITEPGELVVDFFLGSGTTAAVAHKTGRQYIGIEQLNYGENDGVVRLKNVISGDQSGISKAVGWKGGGDLVTCELMQWNGRCIGQIQAAQSTEELQALWETLQAEAFLSYKVDFDQFNEHAEEFAQLSLADQKRFLLEVLDKNQLYVNLSEIDDADYQVSEEDKRLNRQFYKQV